jgi:hypothetical protein
MRYSLLLLPLALTACPKKTDATAEAGAADAAAPVVADAAVATEAPPTPGTPPPFITVPPLPTGAIAVKGYPAGIGNGMNDFAKWAGFSKDGTYFGYCGEGGGIESANCEFHDRADKVTTMASKEGDGSPGEKAKRKAIDDFIAKNGIPAIKPAADPTKTMPPALTGTWPYTDITIDVAAGTSNLQIGGTVKGETAPVHPISLVAAKNPTGPHFVAANVMAVNGSDIGVVGTFFAGEYSDSFSVKRMPLGAFASLVYNDTGFRHHQKNEFKQSSDLFTKAVAANPKAPLPAYNLACALARLKDAHAKDALAYAIALDPKAKTRAPTDKDFDGVKNETWFKDVTK